jgi:hypothetical protein
MFFELPVKHAAGHVLAMSRVTLDHLIDRLKAGIGNLRNSELLVIGLLSRDDRSVSYQWEVNPWVGHQVGLELREIHIECPIKSEGGSDRGNNLADETVEIRVGGTIDVKIPAADVVDRFIIHHESTVGVLEGSVSGQNRVVRLNNGRGNLGSIS